MSVCVSTDLKAPARQSQLIDSFGKYFTAADVQIIPDDQCSIHVKLDRSLHAFIVSKGVGMNNPMNNIGFMFECFSHPRHGNADAEGWVLQFYMPKEICWRQVMQAAQAAGLHVEDEAKSVRNFRELKR